ncbi:hypothetical protein ACIGQE_21775 [Streptomyces sp. NPDC053429]
MGPSRSAAALPLQVQRQRLDALVEDFRAAAPGPGFPLDGAGLLLGR